MYINYFDGYSVASPSNSVFDKSFDFNADDEDMIIQDKVHLSQDSYLKNHNDGIQSVPSSIPVNTPISEYKDNFFSDNFSFIKEHSMSTYLGKEYLSNIIINVLENKIKRRNISQWTWIDNNISICEPQTFKNKITEEDINVINYSSNSNNKLISFVSGMNINSVERGHSSQKMTIDSNLTKIPNPKPIDFCYYLASSHEFVNGEVIDERSLDLQIVENETYYEQLTLSFNKLYNVNFYTLWYTNEHDEQFHHNIQQSDLTYYVDKSNNNIKAKYSKIFKELGEYSNIQIRRGDSNEFSEPVEYIATSSYIDNSFEVSENSNKDLILSWNLQESVSKIKVIILDTNTKEVIQEEEFNADGISQAYFSNISSKDLNITLIKSNGLKKQELKRYYTMQDIYTTIDTDPTAYLNQDKYDLNKDYILFTYPIHQSHYSNVEKLEIIIDGEYFDTLYKSDFDTSSDIEKAGEIVINEATQAGFLFKPHSIQLIPYNKYNEKGISGNIINVNMTLLSLKPLVSKPAANYVEDTYYPEGDILTFSWYTHQNRYPDVSYIEMVVNGEVKKTLKREDMYGTSSSVDKGFKTNVSVHTDQIVELKGYDKFGVMRASRDINVTMNPRNLNPIVKLCPVKSDYENNLLVYTTLNAYPNATSVNISINGQSTIISLDTLIEGSTMGGDKAEFKIPIDANSTGVVKVIATNRYGIESAISCESTSSF